MKQAIPKCRWLSAIQVYFSLIFQSIMSLVRAGEWCICFIQLFGEPHPAVLCSQPPLAPWSVIYGGEEEEAEDSACVVVMGQASERHTLVLVTFSWGELCPSDTHIARDTGKCSLAVCPQGRRVLDICDNCRSLF